ncbi:hypothetical protein [Winogradskyella sp.]|uniref:hypothetical protein n=1 Tax=Winogradskyella sp. TaxID=1883156 RepID=UPI003512D9CA
MDSTKRYLYYKPRLKYGEGLMDRRSCLMIQLAEAKLSNRVAVISKFKLGGHHNNGKSFESYLIDDYFNIDRLNVEYIFEEDFFQIEESINPENVIQIQDEKFDFETNHKLVIRNLKDDNYWSLKLYDVFALAKLYHGVGVKFVIPEVTPTQKIKDIGNVILNTLEKPTIGLHLRRGDRLNKKLNDSMGENTILQKLKDFKFNSAYYGTNDRNYNISDSRFFSSKDYRDVFDGITDNYLLFAIEMYIIDNCDISIRTFNDSSPFYYIENQTNKNYAICNYSMHGSNNSFRKIPSHLVECNYEDKTKNNRKAFVKSRPFIPRLIMAIRRKLKMV